MNLAAPRLRYIRRSVGHAMVRASFGVHRMKRKGLKKGPRGRRLKVSRLFRAEFKFR